MDYVFEVAMMSDLISRSWMMEQLDGLGDTRLIKRNFVALAANAPTVDAVPVVRCRECKHRYSDSWCEYVDYDDNFYCARGERKDGGHDG